MSMESDRQQLVISNLKLVHYIVQKKFNIGPADYSYEDLFSIGALGLVKAANTFNKGKGKFATYAYKCICNEINMHYRKANKYVNDVSLSSSVARNDEEPDLKLEDILISPDSDFVEKLLNDDNETIKKTLYIILNYLNLLQKFVILHRFEGITQHNIAKISNYSSSYISKIELKGLSIIKRLIDKPLIYNKGFSVDILHENTYVITFSTEEVTNFDENFITFLEELKQSSEGFDFKFDRTKKLIIIHLLQIPYALITLAKIIQKI